MEFVHFNLLNYDPYQVYLRWRAGSGPFECFVRATNFTSMKHYGSLQMDLYPEIPEAYGVIESILKLNDSRQSVLFLDLPAVQGIPLGYRLQKEKNIKPIITFNHPLHARGLVGGDRHTALLCHYGMLLDKKCHPEGYIFILDNTRYGDYPLDVLKDRFNNQYELTEDDLPQSRFLRHFGYSRVVALTGRPMEDMDYYLENLGRNDIEVLRHSLI